MNNTLQDLLIKLTETRTNEDELLNIPLNTKNGKVNENGTSTEVEKDEEHYSQMNTNACSEIGLQTCDRIVVTELKIGNDVGNNNFSRQEEKDNDI